MATKIETKEVEEVVIDRGTQLVSNKRLKKQAEIWLKDDKGLMTPAGYRLLVYLEIEDIPEDILEYMEKQDPTALDNWNDHISFKDINTDIEMLITTIFNSLQKRTSMEAFMFIPVLLADLFVLNKGVSKLEGTYRKLINEFGEMYAVDQVLAEIDAITGIAELVKDIANRVGIKLQYDIDEVVTILLTDQQLMDKPLTMSGLDSIIDKAMDDYEKATGKSAIEGVEKGVDTEALQKEIDKLREQEENDPKTIQ